MPWLTITIFLPTVGAALLTVLRRSGGQGARVISLAFTILTAVLSVALAIGFNGASPDYQLEDPKVPWVPALGINFHVALDGISLWLFLLTTFLSVIAVLGPDKYHQARFSLLHLLLLPRRRRCQSSPPRSVPSRLLGGDADTDIIIVSVRATPLRGDQVLPYTFTRSPDARRHHHSTSPARARPHVRSLSCSRGRPS